MKKVVSLLITLALLLTSASALAAKSEGPIVVDLAKANVTEDGEYTAMEQVAAYLHTFGRLPGNFITKRNAQDLGWDSRDGNLNQVAPGKSIGGDHFGNYEGVLPDKKSRQWTECDIDSDGGYRNGLRICFSNDGLIYYSDDHYNTFREVTFVQGDSKGTASAPSGELSEDGFYLTRDDVAAYLHAYGKLPGNYVSKSTAKTLGWSNKKDNLDSILPGYAIGGDSFGNREGLLPDKDGRQWYECDVNTEDGHRGEERLVYSSDGLIYYTPAGYKNYTQLY